MAKQLTVALIDDLDGGIAEQTVAFSVDGQQYEIDLSRQNIQRLHDILAPFMTKARRARPEAGERGRIRQPRTTAQTTPPDGIRTPPTSVTTTSQDNGTRPAPQPPIPTAQFSNPDRHTPALTTTTPKPRTTGLFSATG